MAFQTEILQRFQSYQIPVIKLKKTVQKEAVCHVFEKVNTGGVVLNEPVVGKILIGPQSVAFEGQISRLALLFIAARVEDWHSPRVEP